MIDIIDKEKQKAEGMKKDFEKNELSGFENELSELKVNVGNTVAKKEEKDADEALKKLTQTPTEKIEYTYQEPQTGTQDQKKEKIKKIFTTHNIDITKYETEIGRLASLVGIIDEERIMNTIQANNDIANLSDDPQR